MVEVNSSIESKQYIVVKIGNEQYGIDIQYIDNIIRMQRITRVPKAQNYFKGVINLRGDIVPVMSLRLRFHLEADEYTNSTRIIILKLEPQYAVGVIVDEVKEVITISDNVIEKMNQTGGDDNSIYLTGVGKHEENLISILNISGVINGKDTN